MIIFVFVSMFGTSRKHATVLDENVIARLSALAVVGHVGVAQRSGDWRSSPRSPVPVDVAVTVAVSSSPAGNGPGPAGSRWSAGSPTEDPEDAG
jgi:hypothetical protein